MVKCVGDDTVSRLSCRYIEIITIEDIIVIITDFHANIDIAVVIVGTIVCNVQRNIHRPIFIRYIGCDAVQRQVDIAGRDVGNGACASRGLNADDGILTVVETVVGRTATDALLVGVEG